MAVVLCSLIPRSVGVLFAVTILKSQFLRRFLYYLFERANEKERERDREGERERKGGVWREGKRDRDFPSADEFPKLL